MMMVTVVFFFLNSPADRIPRYEDLTSVKGRAVDGRVVDNTKGPGYWIVELQNQSTIEEIKIRRIKKWRQNEKRVHRGDDVVAKVLKTRSKQPPLAWEISTNGKMLYSYNYYVKRLEDQEKYAPFVLIFVLLIGGFLLIYK